jgi:hypothetical protein
VDHRIHVTIFFSFVLALLTTLIIHFLMNIKMGAFAVTCTSSSCVVSGVGDGSDAVDWTHPS